MPTPNENISLSRADLLTLIQEIRKPVKTEKEIQAERQQEADRERMMETLKLQEHNRQEKQRLCSHMRANGSTTAVFITDMNKMYCQACAGWISPYENPEVFNRLYQLAV